MFKPRENVRARRVDFIVPVENLNVDLESVCKAHKVIKEWLFILHDKDEGRPHYHIYIDFGNTLVSFGRIAGWFDISVYSINNPTCPRNIYLRYFIHGNEHQSSKHQYSPSEVVANFDYLKSISTI